MQPGQVWRLGRFYLDRETGELRTKYLLVLAVAPGGDIVGRLLTSRSHGRPEMPPCFHGDPYPGYYLGTLGGPLGAGSWLDLRKFDELDEAEVRRATRERRFSLVLDLPRALFRDALDCAARADDTTTRQMSWMLDQLAALE